MQSQWPCLLILLLLIALALAAGAYYTILHPKQIHLESCYLKGGSCRETWNCEERFRCRVRTTCINKRKICCMKTMQIRSLQDAEYYVE